MSTITTQDGTKIYYEGPTRRRPAGIPPRVKGITRRTFVVRRRTDEMRSPTTRLTGP